MHKRIVDDWHPEDFQEVRYKQSGNILEVTACSRHNNQCYIRKLSDNQYVYLPTGEVMDCKHIETRADNTASVRASLSRLRDYINTNVTDVRNVRWCTLTYAENMTDTERLYDDFRKFNQRLQYWLKKQSLPKCEYIVAMEPQKRGAWHAHLLLIFPSEAPFISNEIFAKIWGHGFVKITSLDSCDNVGAYLTAYLSDFDIPDGQHYNGKFKTVNGKRYAKGARLQLYPPKFNLYRMSKGIKPPTIEHLPESEAKEKVSAATPTFERTIELTDPVTGFSIVINKRYYNKSRKKGQVLYNDAPKTALPSPILQC